MNRQAGKSGIVRRKRQTAVRKQRGAFKCIRNSLLEVRAGWVLEQLGTHHVDLPRRGMSNWGRTSEFLTAAMNLCSEQLGTHHVDLPRRGMSNWGRKSEFLTAAMNLCSDVSGRHSDQELCGSVPLWEKNWLSRRHKGTGSNWGHTMLIFRRVSNCWRKSELLAAAMNLCRDASGRRSDLELCGSVPL